MRNTVMSFLQRGRFSIIAAVFLLTIASVGVTNLIQPSHTVASGCPQTSTPQFNIIYCGLSGSTSADYINSFKTFYNNNSDGRSNDLQAVYNWAGASPAMVAGMNTTNTVLGVVDRNGNVTANGQVVATNAWVSARWNNHNASGFVPVEGNVWARAATTYLDVTPTVQVLVHFNDNGQADFAVMICCGNAIKLTPMPVPPKPSSLTCDLLTKAPENDSAFHFAFTAHATAVNTTISSYTFSFGDGTNKTVNTSDNTANTDHTYSQPGTFTASVTVNGPTTSQNCTTTVTISQSLACVQLTSTPVAGSTAQFTFTATASAVNTAITSYTFDFGDGSTQTVTTGDRQATATHTYTQMGQHNASVVVNGSATSDNCKTQITASTPPTPTPPQTPLVNTGPGSVIGLFGAATVAGGLFHNLVIRRKFQS